MSVRRQVMVAIIFEDARAISRCDGIDRRGINCVSTLELHPNDEVKLELRDGQRHKFYPFRGRVRASERLFDGTREVRVDFINPEPEHVARLLRSAVRWGVCQTEVPQPRSSIRLIPLEAVRRLEVPSSERQEMAKGLIKNTLFISQLLEAPINSEVVLCFKEVCVPARVVLVNAQGTALLHDGLNPISLKALRRIAREPPPN